MKGERGGVKEQSEGDREDGDQTRKKKRDGEEEEEEWKMKDGKSTAETERTSIKTST